MGVGLLSMMLTGGVRSFEASDIHKSNDADNAGTVTVSKRMLQSSGW